MGELAGGMAAWRAAGLPEGRLELIGPEHADDGLVLDVRQASEVAGLLERAGRRDLRVVVGGGPAEWSAATGHTLAGS